MLTATSMWYAVKKTGCERVRSGGIHHALDAALTKWNPHVVRMYLLSRMSPALNEIQSATAQAISCATCKSERIDTRHTPPRTACCPF